MGLGAGAPPISPPQLKEKRTFPSHNSQPATFQDWLDRIQEAENRQAVLREMFVMLFPGRDPPTLAKLGSFALKVGGASRLAELMWKCSARPPTGDVLAYLYGIHRHNSSGLSYRDERDVRDLEVLIHR
jgi:hypothetical protein